MPRRRHTPGACRRRRRRLCRRRLRQPVAALAGLRLPIVTHPLQAFVTEAYKPVLDRIVASQDLLVYVSQSARGELLAGAEIERYTSYSTRSTFAFLSEASARCVDLFPFMARLRVLRQWTGVCDMTPDYSPLMGTTEVEGFYLNAGWGTWGFKATPIAGVSMAELVATGKVRHSSPCLPSTASRTGPSRACVSGYPLSAFEAPETFFTPLRFRRCLRAGRPRRPSSGHRRPRECADRWRHWRVHRPLPGRARTDRRGAIVARTASLAASIRSGPTPVQT